MIFQANGRGWLVPVFYYGAYFAASEAAALYTPLQDQRDFITFACGSMIAGSLCQLMWRREQAVESPPPPSRFFLLNFRHWAWIGWALMPLGAVYLLWHGQI